MARIAVISDGTVVNVIEADPDFTLDGFTLIQTDEAGPGWTYDGSSFTAPTHITPVPISVSPRQARLALNAAGLLDTINSAVAAADSATQIAWDYATEIRRDNPLIAAVAAALNPPLTSEQIDDLFRVAESIE